MTLGTHDREKHRSVAQWLKRPQRPRLRQVTRTLATYAQWGNRAQA
jgi:hypothetical protein